MFSTEISLYDSRARNQLKSRSVNRFQLYISVCQEKCSIYERPDQTCKMQRKIACWVITGPSEAPYSFGGGVNRC